MMPLYGYKTRLCDLKTLFSLNSSENSSCNAQNYFLEQQRARLSDGRTCPPPLPPLLPRRHSRDLYYFSLFVVMLCFYSILLLSSRLWFLTVIYVVILEYVSFRPSKPLLFKASRTSRERERMASQRCLDIKGDGGPKRKDLRMTGLPLSGILSRCHC